MLVDDDGLLFTSEISLSAQSTDSWRLVRIRYRLDADNTATFVCARAGN